MHYVNKSGTSWDGPLLKSKENYNMMIENEKTIAKVINVAICVTLIAIFCTLFARAIY